MGQGKAMRVVEGGGEALTLGEAERRVAAAAVTYVDFVERRAGSELRESAWRVLRRSVKDLQRVGKDGAT